MSHLSHEEGITSIRKAFKKTQLLHIDFPNGPITVTLREGSFFCLYNAVAWVDKQKQELLVFTEHEGHFAWELGLIQFWAGPEKLKGRK